MKIRRDRAGSDSFGNVWGKDGDVLDLPLDQARELLPIRDGGFSLVEGGGDVLVAPAGDGSPAPGARSPVVAGDGSGVRARTAAKETPAAKAEAPAKADAK